MDFFPQLDVETMGKAFELIMDGRFNRINGSIIDNIDGETNDNGNGIIEGNDRGNHDQHALLLQRSNNNANSSNNIPAYMRNASLDARNQINR